MAKTILIVDDDPAQRRLLQAAVERNGFSTRTAENGQQAVDQVDAHADIDCVLLDLVRRSKGKSLRAVVVNASFR